MNRNIMMFIMAAMFAVSGAASALEVNCHKDANCVNGDTTNNTTNNTTNEGGQGGNGGAGGSVKNSGNSSNKNKNTNTATGGNATIESGAVDVNNKNTNTNLQGQIQGQAQSNENNSSGNNTTITTTNVEAKRPVSSAASTFATVCSNGVSYQGANGGVSLSNSSDVCTYLMVADAYNALGERAKVEAYVEKAADAADRKGFFGIVRSVLTLGILN